MSQLPDGRIALRRHTHPGVQVGNRPAGQLGDFGAPVRWLPVANDGDPYSYDTAARLEEGATDKRLDPNMDVAVGGFWRRNTTPPRNLTDDL